MSFFTAVSQSKWFSRRSSGWLPALLLLAPLGAPAPVVAQGGQGSLRFDRMSVASCKEMGSCEWRLTCRVKQGKEINEIEVVASFSGNNGAKSELGKRVPIPTFPATVECSAYEDDGVFGVEWELVGTGSVNLSAGGDFTMALASAEQGQVELAFIADSLEAPAGVGANAARRFYGTYREAGKSGSAVVIGLEWPAFQARWKQLTGLPSSPLRLVSLETWQEGKKRLWAGIFRPGKEAHALEAGVPWEKFVERFKDYDGKGVRLVDLESWPEGGKRLFAGAYAASGGGATLWTADSKGFHNKWSELSGQKMRLTDLEVYRGGKAQTFAGLFREGEGGFGLYTDLPWDAFQKKWKEVSGRSQRLIDLETYNDGKKLLFSGVFRGGSGEHALDSNLAWGPFAAKWKEHAAADLQLIDFETVPE